MDGAIQTAWPKLESIERAEKFYGWNIVSYLDTYYRTQCDAKPFLFIPLVHVALAAILCADFNTDSDFDTYGGRDSHRSCYSHTHSHTYANSIILSHGDADIYSSSRTRARGNIYTNTNAFAHSDTDIHPIASSTYFHADADKYNNTTAASTAIIHANTDKDVNADTNSYADIHAVAATDGGALHSIR